MTNSSEFTIWHTMKARVLNPNATGYARYGGKGVTICAEWLESFENFYRDMGPRPSPNHSIDRYPDKHGNYEPDNTRWATWEEQNRNKSSNHEVTFNGVTLILVEWAEVIGISAGTISTRLYKGWTIEEALTIPKRGRRKVDGK